MAKENPNHININPRYKSYGMLCKSTLWYDIYFSYAKKHNYPVLNNVALPRVSAMHTILSSLHPACATLNENHNHISTTDTGK